MVGCEKMGFEVLVMIKRILDTIYEVYDMDKR